jgi:hypothetical protein
MNKLFTLLFLVVLSQTISFAQYTINIEASNSNGETQNNLIIGVDPAATDYIDEEPPLNEYEHPGLGRGGQLACFFIVPDKNIEGASTNTYIDYKQEDTSEAFVREYNMYAQFGAQDLTLKWNIPANARLDSAYIKDNLTGNLFYYDMLAQDQCTLNNSAWKRIKITLVFKNPVSVLDDVQNDAIALYPNPAQDYLKINASDISYYKIFDSKGNEVLNQVYNGEMIDISALENGFYNIVLIDNNAKMISKKFIKL